MERLKRIGFALALTLALAGAATLSAQAQDRHERGGHPSGHTTGGRTMGTRPPAPPRGRPPAPPSHAGTLGRHGTPAVRPGTRAVRPGTRAPAHSFRGRDFTRFSPAERRTWTGGHWRHEWHNGVYGWWWAVGGLWYFYPAPVYPYPGYVSDYVWQEPAAPTYPPNYWYYCASSGQYYPNVQTCAVPWTPVAPTP